MARIVQVNPIQMGAYIIIGPTKLVFAFPKLSIRHRSNAILCCSCWELNVRPWGYDQLQISVNQRVSI